MNIHQTLFKVLCLFFIATGYAHSALVANDDSYGIPVSRILSVEAFGVLDNDTLDDQNAGENGVTATLHTDVSQGTLSCPGVGAGLCADGSFEYTPGTGFDGFDSFQYQAVSVSTSESSPPITVTLSACSGGPQTYTCWKETSYLAKLSELGYNNSFQESFEGTAWDVVRSPGTAPGIQSKGITWTTNHPATNEITTGSGPARTGLWGVYDPNHGVATGTNAECDIDNPPVHCLPFDGFSGSMPAPDVLYGIGGYISGFSGANVDIILDGAPYNAGKVSAGYHFMGVIDTAGFNTFQYRELDGKVGQFLFIFGDDFTIATSATPPINNTPILVPIGNKATDENKQLGIPVSASDPDDGDTVSFSLSGAPAGAVLFDNGDGTADFVWRPDYSQAGDYTVTFTVSDSAIPAATDSEMITITVNDVNRPPILDAIGNKSVDENTGLGFLLTASDPDGNSLGFVKSGGPTAATLIDHGDGTATFNWTPDFGQAGDHPVTFTVSDDGAPVASDLETITITVVDPFADTTPPVISLLGVTPVSIELGNVYTDAGATAVDNIDGDISASITATSTVNTNLVGSYAVTYSVSDAAGNPATPVVRTVNVMPPVGSLQYSSASYSTAENGAMATITVARVNGSFGTVGVNYASTDGSATDGVDYTAVSGSLVFADGELTKLFSVPLFDDNEYEGDETVNLSLSFPTGGASLGSPSTGILTITEDDPVPSAGSLQFSTPTYTKTESGASAIITVTRINGSFGTVGVDYASSDGTASAGSDYTAVSGRLSFANGVTSQTFNVDIFDDADYEGDETLNLMLSNTSGGAGLDSPSTAVLTIIEDDPVPPSGSLQFSAPGYTVAEDGITATITVTRAGVVLGRCLWNMPVVTTPLPLVVITPP